MTLRKTVKLAQLKALVGSGALQRASLVGEKGGWSVRLHVDGTDHELASADGRPRIYSTADSAIAQIRKLGMDRMDVIADCYEPGTRRAGRPDRAIALAETAEYGRWLRERVQSTAE